MRKSAPYAVIGLGVIIMAAIAWWFGFRDRAPEITQEPQADVSVSEGLSIYTNGEYGFLLTYPEGSEVSERFDHARLPDAWRVNAMTDASGTPLLSVTVARYASETSYPRFYEALVRLGRSDEARDVSTCETARIEQGESRLEDRIIGERTWKAFSFGDAGMMQYVRGVSYRTVRDGACYALEAIEVGSNYREEPNAADLSDEVLAADYATLDTIIESFRFVR